MISQTTGGTPSTHRLVSGTQPDQAPHSDLASLGNGEGYPTLVRRSSMDGAAVRAAKTIEAKVMMPCLLGWVLRSGTCT